MLKIFIKTIAKSFLNRLIRRENIILFKWCFFSFATYVKGFYYIVVDFLRGSEAENKIFERRYNTRFLMNLTAVENLNNVIYILLNEINCNEDKSSFV